MGVAICLAIRPEAIDAHAWKDFYARARTLLTNHPDGLVSLRCETLGDTRRRVYSRALEHNTRDPALRQLRVCGDVTSRRTAETFCLFEDIANYRVGGAVGRSSDLPPLVLDAEGGVQVFAEKTQGRPYHFPVLSVALLAEALFPGHALVSGDIDPGQCERASRSLENGLGIRAPIPVLTDADRLYQAMVSPAPTLAAIRPDHAWPCHNIRPVARRHR